MENLDSLKATELRLALPGTEEGAPPASGRACKRMSPEAGDGGGGAAAQPSKAQVVGWPPIRSYRKSYLEEKKNAETFVKVSMDGAPYLRKIDLGVHRGYKELRESLVGMFKCFSLGFSSTEGGCSSEYAIAYEDKDGDWMLAGDVPWEMFASSCKKLRIMKWAEARGLGSSS
ncbi:unnamed protein product [Spirodela intermedia]|uniref:Auxin-responsive protein n=1 Tax=Spirodela intermedia TaxID=51605 RepID=A0A7I8JWK5_SPIIN|nr:unnamed protein product [Spirodela intermedia]